MMKTYMIGIYICGYTLLYDGDMMSEDIEDTPQMYEGNEANLEDVFRALSMMQKAIIVLAEAVGSHRQEQDRIGNELKGLLDSKPFLAIKQTEILKEITKSALNKEAYGI